MYLRSSVIKEEFLSSPILTGLWNLLPNRGIHHLNPTPVPKKILPLTRGFMRVHDKSDNSLCQISLPKLIWTTRYTRVGLYKHFSFTLTGSKVDVIAHKKISCERHFAKFWLFQEFAPVVAVSFVVLFNPDSSKLSIAKVKINRQILNWNRQTLK